MTRSSKQKVTLRKHLWVVIAKRWVEFIKQWTVIGV